MKKKLFKAYDSYRESETGFIGAIPTKWGEIPNKRIFKLKKNQVGKKSSEYDLLSLTLKGIVVRDLDNGGKFPAEFDTYQEVKKGDFVFCLFDVEETPRTIGLSDYDGMITGAYTVMEPNDNFNRSFLYYFYLNLDSKKRLKSLYKGLRNTIPKDSFFSLKTFVPSFPEQTTIASFLDDKTVKIDQAIAQKEQLIEMLKERKQILIQELVTGKKVWDDATQSWIAPKEVVDSGVEWIGDIPKGWQLKKTKYILNERNERTPTGDEPLFMMSQVHGLVLRSDFHKKAEVAESTIGNKIVHKNDLVFNKLKAHLGVFFKSKIEYKGIVSPDYAVYYSNGQIEDLTFLEVLFRNPLYIGQFITRATGIVEGLIRLYTDDLFDIEVGVPPIEDQRNILKEVSVLSVKYDLAISLQKKQIKKLKEYKSVLIDSAVTGKIKVC